MRLGEVCDIRNGSTPSKGNRAYWERGTVPWFTIDDMREQGRSISYTKQKITQAALKETSVKLLPEDSVLLCCTASVGEFAITRIPLTTNQQFNGLVIRNRNQLDPNFLFHYMATLKDGLLGISGKTTIDFIPISRLRDVTVPIPTLPEQQRIVGILDKAFEAIATAKSNAEQNLQNSRSILDRRLEATFEENKDICHKELLSSIATFKNGINYTKQSNGERVGVVGVKDFQDRFAAELENIDTISIDGCLSEAEMLRDGDLLVVRSNGNPELVGRCMLVTAVKKRTCHSGFTIQVRLSTREILPKYLCYFMRSIASRKHLVEQGTGTNIRSLNQQALSSLPIWFPSVEEQTTLVSKFDSISTNGRSLVAQYERKIQTINELGQSILSRAFNGQL